MEVKVHEALGNLFANEESSITKSEHQQKLPCSMNMSFFLMFTWDFLKNLMWTWEKNSCSNTEVFADGAKKEILRKLRTHVVRKRPDFIVRPDYLPDFLLICKGFPVGCSLGWVFCLVGHGASWGPWVRWPISVFTQPFFSQPLFYSSFHTQQARDCRVNIAKPPWTKSLQIVELSELTEMHFMMYYALLEIFQSSDT